SSAPSYSGVVLFLGVKLYPKSSAHIFITSLYVRPQGATEGITERSAPGRGAPVIGGNHSSNPWA
ncbi:hypothetical protein BaRGS_00006572, partial [Batillaria attramentaria]